MTIDEIMYRLQAMTTMCTFQDAVGHDLSQKEIKLYNQAKDEAIKTMRKYQQLQADYENRLKADLKAMLRGLKKEIEQSCICTYDVDKLIQQKINELKGNKDGSNTK